MCAIPSSATVRHATRQTIFHTHIKQVISFLKVVWAFSMLFLRWGGKKYSKLNINKKTMSLIYIYFSSEPNFDFVLSQGIRNSVICLATRCGLDGPGI